MENLLRIIKAMSDRNRLRILNALLSYEELCACQITELLEVAGATASRHLNLMRAAGVLKNRKQGRWIYFRLNAENTSLDAVYTWIAPQLENSNQAQKDLAVLEKIVRIPCEDLCRKQREKTACAKK